MNHENVLDPVLFLIASSLSRVKKNLRPRGAEQSG